MKLRTFISIPVPNTMGLSPLIRDLKTVRGLRTANLKQLHITLRFLGDVDEERIDDVENIVNEVIRGIQRSRLNLKGTGVFPNESAPRHVGRHRYGIASGTYRGGDFRQT